MTSDAVTSNRYAQARNRLENIAGDPSVLQFIKMRREADAIADDIQAKNIRIAILPSFTFEPIEPALVVRGLRAGMNLKPWLAPFDQAVPTLIAQGGPLDQHIPDIVYIATRVYDMIPELYDGIPSTAASTVWERADHWLDELDGALRAYRQRSRVLVLIQTIERPVFLADGPVDQNRKDGQTSLWNHVNLRLHEITNDIGNAHALDYDGFVVDHGVRTIADRRLELYGRMPINANHYWDYAGFIVRHIRPFFGLSKKVIVLDADNTLWGGIIGDDGIEGIQLGNDFPGNAFVRFQRRLLAFRDRGIVLAIASKNEPGSVEAVLDNHPDMILRRDHFSALAVSWDPKPDSVKRIAETLNLGLDSFVFLDDSEVECAQMREFLPQVETIQLPKDPSLYADVIAELDGFDQFALSEEDRHRADMYRAESQRKELKQSSLDLETFYHNLNIRLTVGVNDLQAASRAAQMTNRTNQFNMNTVRCTDDQIRDWMQLSNTDVFTLRMEDRFGDNGVVGLAVVDRSNANWLIELFMMSCRVLGRTVETSFLSWIAIRAKDAGASILYAKYTPSAKNKPFSSFFGDNGFDQDSESDDVQLWRLNLRKDLATIPGWIKIGVTGENTDRDER